MLSFIEQDKDNPRNGIYKCVCGTVKSIRKSAVNCGSTKSCGCHRRNMAVQNGKAATTHGLTNTFIYKKWIYLKKNFLLCKEWKDFSKFYEFIKGKEHLGISIKPEFEELSPESIVLLEKQKAKQLNRKQTCLIKYGVESTSRLEKTKKRARETNIKRYGSHPAQTAEVKEKIKKTMLEKYGVEHCMYLEKYKKAAREKFVIKDGKTTADIAREIGTSKSMALKLVKQHGYEGAMSYEKRYSSIEMSIKTILDEINIAYKQGVTIENIRPDFLIEEHKLVIECDGLYWHSDAINDDKYYHKKKMQIYNQSGYRSLFFREDEIEGRISSIRSIILNALQKCDKIFARKCEIAELSAKETKGFLNNYHIMGYGKGRGLGLLKDGNIVAVMQIVNKNNYIDISRFCTRGGISVVGGFSKLLKQLESYNKDISTFVDLRYGTGQYLPSLGFQKLSDNVSFKWIKNNKTYHRMRFPGNSGYEAGFYKIWDCGQAKYIKKAPFGA